MITVAFWLGARRLFGGRGLSFLTCSLFAMPLDLYFTLQSLGVIPAGH